MEVLVGNGDTDGVYENDEKDGHGDTIDEGQWPRISSFSCLFSAKFIAENFAAMLLSSSSSSPKKSSLPLSELSNSMLRISWSS